MNNKKAENEMSKTTILLTGACFILIPSISIFFYLKRIFFMPYSLHTVPIVAELNNYCFVLISL